MFVTGGIRRGGQEISDAAALYDPATDTWRMVAAPPHPIERNADIAWTGTQFLVWPRHAPANGMLFDPGTGCWTELPPLDEPLARGAMVWTGTDVIITGVNTDDPASFVGTRLSLDDMTWRPIAAAPLPPVGYWEGLTGSKSAIWAGTEMLVWAPWLDTAAPATPWLAYDPVTDTWRTLDLAPTRAHHPTLIWTGDAVLALTPEGVVIYRHP
jgi:hypothetical protein